MTLLVESSILIHCDSVGCVQWTRIPGNLRSEAIDRARAKGWLVDLDGAAKCPPCQHDRAPTDS